jgi:hypothetical protein
VNYHGNKQVNGDLLSQITSWLVGTRLFEQAWSAVSFGSMNWWWSEQLCLFTVGAWTSFLVTEGMTTSMTNAGSVLTGAITGRWHGIKYVWAYMLLGQLVAVSAASNLFYLALSLSRTPPSLSPRSATPALYVCAIFSLVSVSLSPFTNQYTFLPNLLVMHALAIFPFLPTRLSSPKFLVTISSLYGIITVIAAAFRVRTTVIAVLSLPAHARSPIGFFTSALEILYSNPAQASIGWDVIWTSVSFIVWTLARPSRKGGESGIMEAPVLAVATSLVSVGVTAPLLLRRLEGQEEGVKEVKEAKAVKEVKEVKEAKGQ